MDTFGFTILIIVLTTLIASYIRRITRDKCLKSFEGYVVTLELADGAAYSGKLEVESTGMEVIYRESIVDDGILKMSHIVYKDEYKVLNAILRYDDELTEKGRKRRMAALKRTYHPNLFRRIKRKTINFFKLIKDSLMEIMNTLSGKLKSANPDNILAGNEKYTNRINQEMVNTIDASYDPLMEKYIGNIIIVEIKQGAESRKLTGILKEYTQNYIELLEVMYTEGRLCDAVLPRRICSVRGLSESQKDYSIFCLDFDIKKYKKYFSRINVKKAKEE
jgi:small nuclear ribonucleoprotein (snRNP)-like protein